MFDPTAIEEVEIKEEKHEYVFDDTEETANVYPNKSVKIEKFEFDLEDNHRSVGVKKLPETQNQRNVFCCYFCNSKFKAKSILKKHVLNHAVTKPSACDICGCKILQKSYLQYLNEETFICETCNLIISSEGNSFTQSDSFQRCLNKQFFCEVCDYKCTRNSSLKVHLRIHSGEKPFSCEICDYKCTDKRNLLRHLRIHTGEKPYSCTVCDYKCADKSYLRIHLRIHTGQKPFVCEYCDYKSIDKRNLRRHLAVHTGENPHSCEICNYKTVNKRNLRRHLKVHVKKT